LKILEAFAAHTPIVSTTIGAEGIDAVDGRHLLLRDVPREFAEAVVALLRNNVPSGYSTEHGYQLAQEQYDWETAVVPRLLDAHDHAYEMFAAEATT
jgi:glycosyltransferase involved in cell wall biosynthesis